MNAIWHEHFFSPRTPANETDGRFDAIECDNGKCFIYHPREKWYESASSRRAAMERARAYAESWFPDKPR